ncbi:hypothetical protein BaRGS_00021265, partial [Batillaria attramentaria]
MTRPFVRLEQRTFGFRKTTTHAEADGWSPQEARRMVEVGYVALGLRRPINHCEDESYKHHLIR